MNQEHSVVPTVSPITPAPKAFTAKEAILGGYDLAKRHFVEMVSLFVITMSLGAGGALMSDPLANGVAMLVNIWATYAYAVLALRSARGQETSWRDLFDLTPRTFGSLIIASFLVAVATSVGLAFFIVPGLMAIAGFAFFVFGIIDKKLGPVETMRASWQLASPVLWTIVGLYAAIFAAMLLPLFLALVFGFVFQLVAPDIMLGLIIGSVIGIPAIIWLILVAIAFALVGPFVQAWMYQKLSK